MLVLLLKDRERVKAGTVIEVDDAVGMSLIAEGVAGNPNVGQIDEFERAESKRRQAKAAAK